MQRPQANKPVAAPRHSHKVSLAAFALIEHLSQSRDVNFDVVFLDDQAGPNLSHQLVFADNLALCRGQHTEDVERPVAYRYRHPLTRQLVLVWIQIEQAKAELN